MMLRECITYLEQTSDFFRVAHKKMAGESLVPQKSSADKSK